jgi:hypothetical protein
MAQVIQHHTGSSATAGGHESELLPAMHAGTRTDRRWPEVLFCYTKFLLDWSGIELK